MQNAFYTLCRDCGRQILMVQDIKTGRWIPCNPEIHKYKPSGGPETYVSEEGKLQRGRRDNTGEWGYQKHFRSCKAWSS